MRPLLRTRLLRRLVTALGATGLALGACPALGQEGFALPRFSPSPAGDRLFSVPSPYAAGEPLVHGVPLHAALYADYARDPLVLHGARSDRDFGAIVSDQLLLHLDASVALFQRLTLNLDAPLAFQAGSAPSGGGASFGAPPAVSVGDFRLGARITLVGRYFDPFQLAIAGSLWVPTGQQAAYVSDGAVRGMPQIIAGGHLDRLVWSTAVGTEIRGKHPILNIEQGTMLTWGAGAAVLLGEDRALQIGPELTGAVPLGDIQSRTFSMELLGGARRRFAERFEVGLGAGFGLSRGVGTPSFRGVAMLAYTPEILDKRPDRDHDGIADSEDACPDVAGDVDRDPRKNGCREKRRALLEDSDYDSIPDAEDACPKVAGSSDADPKKNGCPRPPPDTDGDSVPDATDACPTTSGVPDADPAKNGCPPAPKDGDGDGVPDAEDACPALAGKAYADPAQNGCPGDRDGDGIRDDKDACPLEKGPVDGDPTRTGCPRDVRVNDDSIVLLRQVEFDSATAKIRRESASILDEIVAVLGQHPEITSLEVQGHTDNRGSAAQNTALSQRRADAVRQALVKRGISPARLTAKGYGPSRPAFANLTTEGRQKNRRVELKILARLPRQEAQ